MCASDHGPWTLMAGERGNEMGTFGKTKDFINQQLSCPPPPLQGCNRSPGNSMSGGWGFTSPSHTRHSRILALPISRPKCSLGVFGVGGLDPPAHFICQPAEEKLRWWPWSPSSQRSTPPVVGLVACGNGQAGRQAGAQQMMVPEF